jgi:hypothetical protein
MRVVGEPCTLFDEKLRRGSKLGEAESETMSGRGKRTHVVKHEEGREVAELRRADRATYSGACALGRFLRMRMLALSKGW